MLTTRDGHRQWAFKVRNFILKSAFVGHLKSRIIDRNADSTGLCTSKQSGDGYLAERWFEDRGTCVSWPTYLNLAWSHSFLTFTNWMMVKTRLALRSSAFVWFCLLQSASALAGLLCTKQYTVIAKISARHRRHICVGSTITDIGRPKTSSYHWQHHVR